MADYEKERPNSVILKHKQKEHVNEEMNIRMEITQKFRDPLTRQAMRQSGLNTGAKIKASF